MEFALCLPILLILTMMTIECCNMIQLKHSLTVAAYEGARMSTMKGVTSADVMATANQVLSDRNVVNGSVSLAPPGAPAVAVGQYITVTASAGTRDNAVFKLPTLDYIDFEDFVISVDTTMMKEY